jgi:hypothetical protein
MTVIPWLAIFAATVASFAVGGLWYSPLLFGRVWMRAAGIDPEKRTARSPLFLYGTTFLLTLISTAVLSFCLAPKPGVLYGGIAGLVIGLGWVTTSIGTNLLFEGRSFAHFAITCGYHIVRFVIAGIILGWLQ